MFEGNNWVLFVINNWVSFVVLAIVIFFFTASSLMFRRSNQNIARMKEGLYLHCLLENYKFIAEALEVKPDPKTAIDRSLVIIATWKDSCLDGCPYIGSCYVGRTCKKQDDASKAFAAKESKTAEVICFSKAKKKKGDE